jgi:hypothetical protein
MFRVQSAISTAVVAVTRTIVVTLGALAPGHLGEQPGALGITVLARLNPLRRPRVCPRRVKSPLSHWNKHPPGKPATGKKITQIPSLPTTNA